MLLINPERIGWGGGVFVLTSYAFLSYVITQVADDGQAMMNYFKYMNGIDQAAKTDCPVDRIDPSSWKPTQASSTLENDSWKEKHIGLY